MLTNLLPFILLGRTTLGVTLPDDPVGELPRKAERSDGQSRRGAIYRAQGWGGADTTEFANSITRWTKTCSRRLEQIKKVAFTSLHGSWSKRNRIPQINRLYNKGAREFWGEARVTSSVSGSPTPIEVRYSPYFGHHPPATVNVRIATHRSHSVLRQ